MSKITFIGAGSSVFAKNILGDVMQTPALQGFEIALFDIDAERLLDSEQVLSLVFLILSSICSESRSASRCQIHRKRHSSRRL